MRTLFRCGLDDGSKVGSGGGSTGLRVGGVGMEPSGPPLTR